MHCFIANGRDEPTRLILHNLLQFVLEKSAALILVKMRKMKVVEVHMMFGLHSAATTAYYSAGVMCTFSLFTRLHIGYDVGIWAGVT